MAKKNFGWDKTSFDDFAPGSRVHLGDLKYGRCKGSEYMKHHDFPAEFDANGKPRNLPAVPVKLVSQRDPSVWSGKSKPPKVTHNTKDFQQQLTAKLAFQTGGLIHNLRVLITK